jgi:hypothetical protein
MSDDEACTLGGAGTTARMAVNGMRPLGQPRGKGEIVLLQGTGGVSISGLLIAKASQAEGRTKRPMLSVSWSHSVLHLLRLLLPIDSYLGEN